MQAFILTALLPKRSPRGPTKRVKQSHVQGGLSTNWKVKVKQAGKAHTSGGSLTSSRLNSSSDSFISGEFDHDETEESLARVEARKNTTAGVKRTRIDQHSTKLEAGVQGSSLAARKTAMMGVVLTPRVAGATTESTVARSVRVRKPRYNVADLLFPAGGKHLQIWRKSFVPSLLAWAGSQGDPFGANGKMNTEIKVIWQRIYPALLLSNDSYEVLQHMRKHTQQLAQRAGEGRLSCSG